MLLLTLVFGALLVCHAAWLWLRFRTWQTLVCGAAFAVAGWLLALYKFDYIAYHWRAGHGTDRQSSWIGVAAGGMLCALALLGPRASGSTCPSADCGASNDPGAKFCRRCGKELEVE